MQNFDYDLSMAIINSLKDCESLSAVGSMSIASTPDLIVAPVRQISSKTKCDCCKRKVGLLGIKCRCGGHYCSGHIGSVSHDCTFDYKTLQCDDLAKSNVKVVGVKVDKL
jgi:hypothetical protein